MIAAGLALVGQIFLVILAGVSIEQTKIALLLPIIFIFLEEISKYFTLVKKIIPSRRQVILSAYLAGIGFALVELFIIYQKTSINYEIANNFDLFKVALLHILTFGFLGQQLTTAKSLFQKIQSFFLVFIVHILYNFSVLYFDDFFQFLDVLILFTLFIANLLSLFFVNKKLAPKRQVFYNEDRR